MPQPMTTATSTPSTAPVQAAVESLLGAVPAWKAAAICANPGALGLAAARARMGTARFVDMGFQFALNRWPAKPEAIVYIRALEGLEHGGGACAPTTEEDFLVELLNSRERADIGPAIRSPWDALYPFGAAPVRAEAAA